MNNIDMALLLSENNGPHGWCPVCRRGTIDGAFIRHADGCAMDLALAERGYATQRDRAAARERIRGATAPTEPPPASGVRK